MTMGMYIALHMAFLLLPAKFIGLALLLLFIIVIYLKIYSFNKFMRQFVHLGEDYKKNPKLTQKKYDQEIDAIVEKIMQVNIAKKQKSKDLEIPSKDEILKQNKIMDLEKLDGIMKDSDFIN